MSEEFSPLDDQVDVPSRPTPSAELSDDDGEFSLEQLSQAYAKILQRQLGIQDVDLEQNADEGEETAAAEIDDLDDQHDNAGVTLNESSIVEAILFVGVPAGEKLTAKRIAAVLRDVSPKEVKKIIQDLNARYDREKTAYRIESLDGGYQMVLRDSLAGIRDKFHGEIREAQLNQMAIDTLSIVAYQQPITRAEIDQIRQRPSGSILTQLVERQLLCVDGETGDKRNKAYRTTDRFLQLFGLSSLDDLPKTTDVDDIGEFFDENLLP